MDEDRARLGPGVEFRRIDAFLEAAAAPPGSAALVRPGDDAAVVRPETGESVVLSCDLAVEGVHFRREWLSWEAIGRRAAAAALSDLAATAARPLGALVSLALAPELDAAVAESLARGLGEALRAERAGLLGGDLARSPGPAVIDVTVVGAVGEPLRRDGGQPGDEVWLTGEVGGAAAAVRAFLDGLEPDPRARRRFERPVPRVREARWLAERGPLHAGIDLSDGLAGDAGHLAAASGLRLELRADAIPLDPVLDEWRDREAALRLGVTGGEDYELLLAAPPGALGGLAAELERVTGTRLTRIGRLTEGDGVAWLGPDGGRRPPPASAGWDHFG